MEALVFIQVQIVVVMAMVVLGIIIRDTWRNR